jgi:hypothetical protein
VTDGRSIVVYYGDLTVPKNQYFTCNGPPGGMRQQQGGGDVAQYYTLPSSIVLKKRTVADPSDFTVAVSEQAALYNCLVRPTWYTQDLADGIGSTRDIVDKIEHSLAGTCITAGGTSASLHDLFIIGCDTGVELNGAGLSVLANLNIEGNVGVYNHDAGDGVKLQNINVQNFVEQFSGGGSNFRESDCPRITTIAEASGSGHRMTIAYAMSYAVCSEH